MSTPDAAPTVRDVALASAAMYRRALKAIVAQHIPDPEDERHCMRCTDCVGDQIEHPCPTNRVAIAALKGES